MTARVPVDDEPWNVGEVCAIDLVPLAPEQYAAGLCAGCATRYCADCWEWFDDCTCGTGDG